MRAFTTSGSMRRGNWCGLWRGLHPGTMRSSLVSGRYMGYFLLRRLIFGVFAGEAVAIWAASF